MNIFQYYCFAFFQNSVICSIATRINEQPAILFDISMDRDYNNATKLIHINNIFKTSILSIFEANCWSC